MSSPEKRANAKKLEGLAMRAALEDFAVRFLDVPLPIAREAVGRAFKDAEFKQLNVALCERAFSVYLNT
jgi:hypothetical protein